MAASDSGLEGWTVTKGGRIRVVTYQDSWDWRCWRCGALGLHCSTLDAAEREAMRHTTETCEERDPVDA